MLTFALFLGQSSAQYLLGGFLPTAKLEELVQEVSWGREGEVGDGERISKLWEQTKNRCFSVHLNSEATKLHRAVFISYNVQGN